MPAHWVHAFQALGCTSVLVNCWFRYRPFPMEDGRYAWVEAEGDEDGVTEKPHQILIRPGAVDPFLVIWRPDETFLHTLRRSRFQLHSADPVDQMEASRVTLERLVRRLQARPLKLMA